MDSKAMKHLKQIQKSINELYLFQDQTKSPNPISNQYIGTVVDNTIGLLCSVANSLDKGDRYITFDQWGNWKSLMQAVHRSFFSSLHIAVEAAISDLSIKYGLECHSSIKVRYVKVVEKITGNEPEKEKLIKYFNKCKPSFEDQFNSLLDFAKFDDSRKKIWRLYFKGLTILRNKASHSDVTLSAAEIKSLKEGGFTVVISSLQELKINTRIYAQIVKHILDFYCELNKGL